MSGESIKVGVTCPKCGDDFIEFVTNPSLEDHVDHFICTNCGATIDHQQAASEALDATNKFVGELFRNTVKGKGWSTK